MTRLEGQIIACLATVFVLGHISSAIFFSLWIPDVHISRAALRCVSGFYGPGSVIAWLILALCNAEFKFIGISMYNLIRSKPTTSNDILTDAHLDLCLVGTVVYPLVATVDFAMKTYQLADVGEAEIRLAGLDAQICILQITTILCIIVVQAQLALILVHYLPEVSGHDISHWEAKYARLSWRRQSRLGTWSLLLCLSQGLLIRQCFPFRNFRSSFFVEAIAGFPQMLGVFMALLLLSHSNSNINEESRYQKWLPAMVFVAWTMWAKVSTFKPDRWRFAIPRSSASITDLDQVAALVCALCTIGYGVARHFRQCGETSSDRASVGVIERSQSDVRIPSTRYMSLDAEVAEQDIADARPMNDQDD